MLIQKCVGSVKERALIQEGIRNSPDRYKKIKSRVRMNMKSQKSCKNMSSPKKLKIDDGGN
jgi:hypothetical protein